MRIRLFPIILALLSQFAAFSQSLVIDDRVKHWEFSFTVGLNTDGYQGDFEISYFPLQHIGVKMRIGGSGEIEELGDWGYDEYETGHYYATRFKFSPSMVLRTPRIGYWKSQEAGFHLFAEPGMVISPGARGSKNPQVISWDLRGGVNMQIDRFIVTVGYGVSNFCLYSGYPANHWGDPDRDKYLTHSGFIGLGCKF